MIFNDRSDLDNMDVLDHLYKLDPDLHPDPDPDRDLNQHPHPDLMPRIIIVLKMSTLASNSTLDGVTVK